MKLKQLVHSKYRILSTHRQESWKAGKPGLRQESWKARKPKILNWKADTEEKKQDLNLNLVKAR